MVFIIKDRTTGQVHEIIKFLSSTTGDQCVWSQTWPGRHIIGQDCDWVKVSDRDWSRISFIRSNPEMTINQLCKKFAVSYTRIFRLVLTHRLTVKREKNERKAKGKAGQSKYFNPNRRNNWMI